jgi:hypothetical protein
MFHSRLSGENRRVQLARSCPPASSPAAGFLRVFSEIAVHIPMRNFQALSGAERVGAARCAWDRRQASDESVYREKLSSITGATSS